ncbi:MAG: DUF2306 domain-containing protein [Sphingobium sp.]
MPEMHLYALPALLRSWRPPYKGPRKIGRGIVFILAILVALISYRYLFDFGPIPPNIANNRYRTVWLTTHAGFAATALLVGAVQFSNVLRERRPTIHRYVGGVYVISCLIGAGAGLVLAAGASAGPIASAGFGTLAVVWMFVNVLGWQRARTRQFAAHRRWMIRSWALTLSAVTLRLYLPLSEITGMPELPAYRAISFLCWVPNLIAAELLLRYRPYPPLSKTRPAPTLSQAQPQL